jgi:23S rRNA pseudouridine1911/1915/1917 synthase
LAGRPIATAGHPCATFPIDLRLYTPDFAVLAESEDFIVVDKPAHLMVHPSNPGNPPTLWDGLRLLLAYELANGGQLSIITRLDRETSGLVLVAKHRGAARTMSKAMERGEFAKTYRAIVWGWPETDDFLIDAPLIRRGEIEPAPVWVRQTVHPSGKACRTEIRVLHRFERADTGAGSRFSLLECRPRTGRMHQIRAHLHHAGYPIVGDKLYGPDEACYLEFIETGWSDGLAARLLLNRQALHASRLEWRDHEWICPLPPDLAAFVGPGAG